MRWLNVSSLKWNDLVSLASKSLRKKLELWYLLGISLDSVLAAPTCSRMVRVLVRARARLCFGERAHNLGLAGRTSGAACGRG